MNRYKVINNSGDKERKVVTKERIPKPSQIIYKLATGNQKRTFIMSFSRYP